MPLGKEKWCVCLGGLVYLDGCNVILFISMLHGVGVGGLSRDPFRGEGWEYDYILD